MQAGEGGAAESGAQAGEGGAAGPGARSRQGDAVDARAQASAHEAGAAAEEGVRVPEAPREGEFLSDLEPLRLSYAPARAGTFSYTGIAAHDKAAAEEDKAAARPADDDEDLLFVTGGVRHASATAFGSALHQACQLMAEDLAWRKGGADGAPAFFEMPSEARLRSCLATWDAPAFELDALKRACGRWLASDAARRAAGMGVLVPEAPFYVALQGTQGEPIHLEGAFDLLCHAAGAEQEGGAAFIVDYKTGGAASETPEELRAKHGLQAACYAYVALCQGFGEVELSFVRVEQEDPSRPGMPQEVHYRFEAADRQELHERIRAAYARL